MWREQGELVDWNDDRGFGFIRRPGAEDLFVHVKAIRLDDPRPQLGDLMRFTVGTGRDGRPAALDVDILGREKIPDARPEQTPRSAPPRRVGAVLQTRLWIAGALVLVLLADIALGRLPAWLGLAYGLAGLVSFFAYWIDKRAAQADRWRIPEAQLHSVDLAFGIVGGLLAQQLFRHKTSKPGFATLTWAIAGLHLLALAAFLFGVIAVGR